MSITHGHSRGMKMEMMLDHQTILENRQGRVFFGVRLQGEAIAEAEEERGAYLFVLDRSHSMSGEAIELARVAVARIIRHLPSNAQVGIVAFDEVAECVLPLTRDASDKPSFAAMANGIEATNGGSNVSAG